MSRTSEMCPVGGENPDYQEMKALRFSKWTHSKKHGEKTYFWATSEKQISYSILERENVKAR